MRSPTPQLPMLGALLSLLHTAVLARPGTPAEACSSLANILKDKIVLPNSSAYKMEAMNYYNAGLAALQPACIAFPTSATEVSGAVQVLSQYPDVPFAVKSGGHDPNAGQSSVDKGVLIALGHMNGTTYDKARGVALVKPGDSMDGIIRVLEPQGVMVPTGRNGGIGVGGFYTQGGLSFFNAQYGMGCDNVVEYETVVANGSIIKINQDNYPDLLQAMRGSGDQFGIVTQFAIKTYPLGKVWGGPATYSFNDSDAMFSAFHSFANHNMDPKAALTFITLRSGGGPGAFMVTYFYDGPEPPPGAFGKLRDVKPGMDLARQQSYNKVVNSAEDESINPFGVMKKMKRHETNSRISFQSITLPYVPSRPDWYAKIDAAWANITSTHLGSNPTFTTSIVFQPLPNIIGRASEARGGNAMGLRGTDHDRFVLEIQNIYQRAEDDAKVPLMYKDLQAEVARQLAEIKAHARTEGIEVGEYNPTYMNDAGVGQDVMGSYRDAAKFRRLQVELDPGGFFAKRAGGYKYPEPLGG